MKAQTQKLIVHLCRVTFCTFQHVVFVLCRLCLVRGARHYVTRITCIETLHYSLGPECAAQYNRQDDNHTMSSARRQHFFFIYDLCILLSVNGEVIQGFWCMMVAACVGTACVYVVAKVFMCVVYCGVS